MDTQDIVGQSEPGIGDGGSYVGAGAEVAHDYEFPTGSVFLLTSKTYLTDPTEWDNVVVGVFVSREAAQNYMDNAEPPVSDGVITKWGIEGAEGFAPVGRIAPFHGVA